MSKYVRRLFAVALCALSASFSFADPARFDLAGPRVDIRVTRQGRTLPIAEVANLQAGDRIWLHPDLPDTQSAHLLLIAAFLRGTTNPPPDNWFTKIETWDKKVKAEGVFVVVPTEAQQALIFLAPETGGDFSTLKNAVRGRPGIFVRASQDLTELGFEQVRIDRYLNGMKQLPPTNDQKVLAEKSELLARTLALKPNADCFKQPVEQQVVCLTQSGNQSVLDDGHGTSIVTQLANGAGADFVGAAAATAPLGGGAYSPYVGAVVDLTKLLTGLHTAQYQYIPAVAFPDMEHFNLRLNAAPSFNNPKSVIVIALPGIQPAKTPPLQPVNPKEVTCLLKPEVVLNVQNAPLVFSTSIAHDMVLHVNSPEARDIPLKADASKGGLVLVASNDGRRPLSDMPSTGATAAAKNEELTGTIHGQWGFDPFDGPTLPLQNAPGTGWKLTSKDAVIVGRENQFTLTSTGVGCVQSVALVGPSGKKINAEFHPSDQPHELAVKAALKDVNAGDLKVEVKQFGDQDAQQQQVETKAYTEAAKLKALKIHSGDTTAMLEGESLDQVQSVELNGITLTPAAETTTAKGMLSLTMAKDAKAPEMKAGDSATAHVHLKDGRTVDVQASILEARPMVKLVNKHTTSPSGGAPSINLSNKDDLPLSDKLQFFLKTNGSYPRAQKIEVATVDGSLKTLLSLEEGTLILQDASTVIANLDPTKAFGASAFGKLQFRPVGADGAAGDWQPLATLVRAPMLKEIKCPLDDNKPCHLVGSNLYLLKAVAATSKFDAPKEVPTGFGDSQLEVPRPYGTVLYVRLLDDPDSVNAVALPVTPEY